MELVVSVPLPDTVGMWAVHHRRATDVRAPCSRAARAISSLLPFDNSHKGNDESDQEGETTTSLSLSLSNRRPPPATASTASSSSASAGPRPSSTAAPPTCSQRRAPPTAHAHFFLIYFAQNTANTAARVRILWVFCAATGVQTAPSRMRLLFSPRALPQAEGADFELRQRTIAAGNLFGGSRIVQARQKAQQFDPQPDATGAARRVTARQRRSFSQLLLPPNQPQVTPKGVRVLAGPMLAQELTLQSILGDPAAAAAAGLQPASAAIVSADICSPFVLLRLSASGAAAAGPGSSPGPLRVLVGNPSNNRLEPLQIPPSQHGLGAADFTAASLYDHARCRCPLVGSLPGFTRGAGAGGGAAGAGGAAAGEAADASSVFAVVARTSGSFEIWALPQARRVFSSDGLADGSQVLCDGPSVLPVTDDHPQTPPPPEVTDIRMDAFGDPSGHMGPPLLTAIRSDGQLLAWKGFHAALPGVNGIRRQLRFRRIRLGDSACLQPAPGAAPRAPHLLSLAPPRLTRVERVCPGGNPANGSVSGVFVTGPHPLWVVVHQGRARAHPVGSAGRGSVASVAPFHNVNCPHGVIISTVGCVTIGI